ncbi:type II toxin-antitoxin system RelE/ParE family toxin [Flavobacterium sp. MAH-1]|uniref:Toxin n=1 Tax=Flavobacterium agri TaxID=2743471 RepID=A0A7Y8Y0W0_9FLAO|nr:type II toxin-antitoxin system RelE/ParE family toxin [Flavobacterium agri]NUY80529.1 type II toxin-antitoxin system RelE/ParE family toxin [Flavobacterium agri]NYA70554.1 type II toxin-antitoxin system RelE/ParE family toxin [Flavobacterium agri]
MAKYYFTNKATEDLIDIWDYSVHEWSENQAEKYYNLIMASCQDLANNPQLGRTYGILALNVLGYKCGQHIIFYREISKNEIEIERVLHGMMDLKNKL